MGKIKIALFLATEKGYACLKSLMAAGMASSIGFTVSFREDNVIHSWHEDIETLCINSGIKYFDWKSVKDSLCSLIAENNITSAAAISWRYMLPVDMNNF